MKLWPYIIGLIVLFIISCSTKKSISSNTSETILQFNEATIDSTVCIFDTSIHLDERIAIRELSASGILKCNKIKEKDGQFEFAVIDFAGVKCYLNKGFVFTISKQDKKTIDRLVSKISSYYGEPYIDGMGDPEYNYYHWNLYESSSNKPYIRIRPFHSDDGGLVMTWYWD